MWQMAGVLSTASDAVVDDTAPAEAAPMPQRARGGPAAYCYAEQHVVWRTPIGSHGSLLTAVAVSYDGAIVVTASGDRKLRVWDLSHQARACCMQRSISSLCTGRRKGGDAPALCACTIVGRHCANDRS